MRVKFFFFLVFLDRTARTYTLGHATQSQPILSASFASADVHLLYYYPIGQKYHIIMTKVRGNQILYFKEQGESKPLGVITLAYPLDKEGVLTRTVDEIPSNPDDQRLFGTE